MPTYTRNDYGLRGIETDRVYTLLATDGDTMIKEALFPNCIKEWYQHHSIQRAQCRASIGDHRHFHQGPNRQESENISGQEVGMETRSALHDGIILGHGTKAEATLQRPRSRKNGSSRLRKYHKPREKPRLVTCGDLLTMPSLRRMESWNRYQASSAQIKNFQDEFHVRISPRLQPAHCEMFVLAWLARNLGLKNVNQAQAHFRTVKRFANEKECTQQREIAIRATHKITAGVMESQWEPCFEKMLYQEDKKRRKLNSRDPRQQKHHFRDLLRTWYQLRVVDMQQLSGMGDTEMPDSQDMALCIWPAKTHQDDEPPQLRFYDRALKESHLLQDVYTYVIKRLDEAVQSQIVLKDILVLLEKALEAESVAAFGGVHEEVPIYESVDKQERDDLIKATLIMSYGHEIMQKLQHQSSHPCSPRQGGTDDADDVFVPVDSDIGQLREQLAPKNYFKHLEITPKPDIQNNAMILGSFPGSPQHRSLRHDRPEAADPGGDCIRVQSDLNAQDYGSGSSEQDVQKARSLIMDNRQNFRMFADRSDAKAYRKEVVGLPEGDSYQRGPDDLPKRCAAESQEPQQYEQHASGLIRLGPDPRNALTESSNKACDVLSVLNSCALSDDPASVAYRAANVECSFQQLCQSLEAITSAIEKTSATAKSSFDAEALAQFGLSLKGALREQKLSDSAIELIIKPCFTSRDIDTSVRLMVASLQAQLESSVHQSVSEHILAQERLRAAAVRHSFQSLKEEFVSTPLSHCRIEKTDQGRWSSHEDIFFEGKHRPLIDIVTSLANNKEYILCLTNNREAVPYELLLQVDDPEAAANNARVLYEAWQRIVATGQTRLKTAHVPRPLAFENCAVKSWDSLGIKFEVTFRNMARSVGNEVVSGSQLREWGSHVLERMRAAVKLYKQGDVPPRRDPAYLRYPS